jgi:transposase-like protein
MAKRNSNTFDGETVEDVLLDDPDFLREIVERTVQQILETEMTAHVGVGKYERGEGRTGHRNGYKPRELRTRVGTLSLLVPQDREGTFSTQLFARYQRNEKALVLALMEMYVEGVSTRKVTEITEVLCGTSFSKSLVSALSGRLDGDLAAWRSRPLIGSSYPYIYVDARYEHVRVDGRVISQGVLIVSGVRGDHGHREILAVDVADTESEATYQDLFRQLKGRGLSGVELVISDDHKGLKAAINRHFQGAGWQRCQVHYTRGLCGQVAATKRKELAAGLRGVYDAPDTERAKQVAGELADVWRKSHPKIAASIDEDMEECLAVFGFPPEHRVRVRTTNGLERLNQEIKRRSAVVRVWPNREACLRMVTALCAEQSDEWVSGPRYLDVELLRESQASRRQERELALA